MNSTQAYSIIFVIVFQYGNSFAVCKNEQVPPHLHPPPNNNRLVSLKEMDIHKYNPMKKRKYFYSNWNEIKFGQSTIAKKRKFFYMLFGQVKRTVIITIDWNEPAHIFLLNDARYVCTGWNTTWKILQWNRNSSEEEQNQNQEKHTKSRHLLQCLFVRCVRSWTLWACRQLYFLFVLCYAVFLMRICWNTNSICQIELYNIEIYLLCSYWVP